MGYQLETEQWNSNQNNKEQARKLASRLTRRQSISFINENVGEIECMWVCVSIFVFNFINPQEILYNRPNQIDLLVLSILAPESKRRWVVGWREPISNNAMLTSTPIQRNSTRVGLCALRLCMCMNKGIVFVYGRRWYRQTI